MDGTFYCMNCGTRLRKEPDVMIVFCPEEQIAWTIEFLENLVKMAVDWRDSADERLHGPSGP